MFRNRKIPKKLLILQNFSFTCYLTISECQNQQEFCVAMPMFLCEIQSVKDECQKTCGNCNKASAHDMYDMQVHMHMFYAQAIKLT